jgi:RimJ/RimL family protein N-acetyltransferase
VSHDEHVTRPPAVNPPIVLPGYDLLPRLSDGRVVVRRWRDDDAPAMAAAGSDPDIARFCALPAPYTLEVARGFIDGARSAWERDHHAHLAIADPDDDLVLGAVGLVRISPGFGSGELGYWVLPAWRRYGIARRAAGLIADWAFESLGLTRLEIAAHASNSASCAVAESLGFRYEALLRSYRPLGEKRSDCLLFGLLPHERGGRAATGGTSPAPAAAPLPETDHRDRPAAQPMLPVEQPTLEGHGLRLRPYRDDDLKPMMGIVNDSEALRWITVLPAPYEESDARSFLASMKSRWPDRHEAAFAVVDPQNDSFLGGLSVRLDLLNAIAELGYRTVPESRGRGVATNAVRAAGAWALDTVGVARVQLTADTRNHASQRVAEKAGFTREGMLRGLRARGAERCDHVMLSLLPGELR